MTAAWPEGPRRPAAGSDAVDLWLAPLDRPPDLLAEDAALLAPDEVARAGRYRFARDRDRFVAARGVLRRLLGRYLDRPPASIRFRYGPRGKPALDLPGPLRFNLAHSGDRALYAVTAGRELGVDLEWMVDRHADEGVARRFFAGEEVAALARWTGAEWRAGFFRCWTRKEAYLKALGDGLHLPLDRFAVSVEPDHAELVAARHAPEELARWSLHALRPAEDFAAALVVERGAGEPALRCWTWRD